MISGEDGTTRLADARTGAEIARVETEETILAVAFGPDGSRLATGDRGGTVRILDGTAEKEILRLEFGQAVRALAFSPMAGAWLSAEGKAPWSSSTAPRARRSPGSSMTARPRLGLQPERSSPRDGHERRPDPHP
jgi:WD40 repeat protein